MYKLLLCWRYLLTRYLALACIISVMLGVATLIVVNSVMGGFSTKLKERLHGLLSDVVIESTTYSGILDPEAKMARIRSDPFLNDKIEAMTPTLEVFALLHFTSQGETFTRYVRVIGIDPKGRAQIGGFTEHLLDQRNQLDPSFEMREDARQRYAENHPERTVMAPPEKPSRPGERPPPAPVPGAEETYDPPGIIVGYAIAHLGIPAAHAESEAKDLRILNTGDDAILFTLGGQKLAPVYQRVAVVDYFKSEMSEYDANYVFVPMDFLQHLRTMENRVTSIQIRLKNYDRDAKAVVDALGK